MTGRIKVEFSSSVRRDGSDQAESLRLDFNGGRGWQT
jgi:hypothetical protein